MTILLSRNCKPLLLFFLVIGIIAFSQQASAEKKPFFDVLFIGNSYTYWNKVPKILFMMINHNEKSPIKMNVDSATAPGVHMLDQWLLKTPLQKIRSKEWHFVVLQNQSNWACFPQMRRDYLQYGRMFADEIRSAGAVPVVVETWPKEPGSQWYKDIPRIKNFAYMYGRLRKHTKEVATHLNAELVPINYYWVKAMEQAPNIRLYNDGSHTSLAGAYLNALVYYKFFTKEPYQNTKSILAGVSDLEAQRLQKVVAEN